MALAQSVILGIDANRTVKDELTAALKRQGRRRRISVTDLVNLRQAFFQRARPDIQPDPERKQAMLAGTGFHEVFGRAVSTEEFVEQFVEFQGIVGKIDIYDDVPVELKTTASLPQGAAAARPSYVDQLGMYCTMTGRDQGRLFVYKRALYGRPGALKGFDVRFKDLTAVEREMVRRRDLFREALASQDPSRLPRCEWFELRCDYRAVCGCALKDALWYGVPGAFARIPVSLRSLKGKVGTFRGVPTIFRSTRKTKLVDRSQLVEEFPYYFDRIAFECALSGHQTGRVVVYYEAVKDDKFMVYDVHFRSLEDIKAEADRRLALLEAGAAPDQLPPCEPSWMPNYCPHGPRCACRPA